MTQSSQTDVRMDDDPALRPEREAVPGAGQRWARRRRGERLMVPKADFRSYYGRPVLKRPTWKDHDIAGYLFLGGLAGASSALAATADVTDRNQLARAAKTAAITALAGSLYCLVHDLGRPARFLNMLRVFKVTSPMSVGSWLLAGYAPLAATAAATELTGRLPRVNRATTVAAGILGPAVATYTAALISDTAVPSWHDAYREMPYLFAGSAMASAAGLAVLTSPPEQAEPARRAAAVGAAADLLSTRLMKHRLGQTAEPLHSGAGGRLMRIGQWLTTVGGLASLTVARRHRAAAVAAGGALLAGALCTRFGIFHAGVASASDPAYTVGPQRARLAERETP